MNPLDLKGLSDLLGQDLAGWKITTCYLLELDNGLTGRFPAIRVDNGGIIAVFEKKYLRWVWNKLEKRKAKITELKVIVNTESGVAFNLHGVDDPFRESTPFHILSIDELDALWRKENSFQWPPSFIDPNSDPRLIIPAPDFGS